MNPVITAAEIAERLDVSKDTFLRERQALERQGFPRPCFPARPGRTRTLRWRRAEIDAWFTAAPPAAAGEAEPEFASVREQLRRRIPAAAHAAANSR